MTDVLGTEAASGRRVMRPGEEFDTREHLANEHRAALERGLDRMLIVDVDAHHFETESWSQISEYLEDDTIRHLDQAGRAGALNGRATLLPVQSGNNQDVSGRITRHNLRRLEQLPADGIQRDRVLLRRAMEAMCIDYQIVFPTPMLSLGLHPQPEIEVAVARAYGRWMSERVLAEEPSLRTMLYLPFSDPRASLALVEEFAGLPGVAGFMITSTRYRAITDEEYVPVYRAIEQSGMPLAFHAGYAWAGDRTMEMLNRFLSVHALGFVIHSMVHLTNWVINGMPERFPALEVIWIESGVAWLPFLMQRLDNEYIMRSSEAPLLERLPSEYIREMYYSTQPLEQTNMRALELTFEMIDARRRLLYSSDYPHWDFDVPSRIYDLPVLDDETRANILGRSAQRLFKLPDPPQRAG
jgi:uncharacterized protein